jgi:ABC-type transport system substrate-binding protein
VGMLGEAGWTIQDSVLKNSNGDAFAFTITITDSAQEKVALAYKSALELIGIAVDVKKVDAAQFSALQRAYDYDMIPVAWYNSLSPGNEPPSTPCSRRQTGPVLNPLCVLKIVCLWQAITLCRSMMRAGSGWRGGTTLADQMRNPCLALKAPRCGMCHERHHPD